MTTAGITGAENEDEGLGCHCLYVFKGIITGSNRLGIRCEIQETVRWVNDNSSAVPYLFVTKAGVPSMRAPTQVGAGRRRATFRLDCSRQAPTRAPTQVGAGRGKVAKDAKF